MVGDKMLSSKIRECCCRSRKATMGIKVIDPGDLRLQHKKQVAINCVLAAAAVLRYFCRLFHPSLQWSFPASLGSCCELPMCPHFCLQSFL